MIQNRRRLLRAAVIGSTAVAASCLIATPAGATPLSASPSCDSGFSQMSCTSGVGGGTSPYSYLWQVTSGSASFTRSTTPDGSGTCAAGQTIHVQVTVTDSTGAHAVGTTFFICRSQPWQ